MSESTVDPVRSRMMASVGGKNTKPEMVVRKFLHAKGFRYRLHARKLPGRPDVVLPRFETAVFVHGCFWHHHEGCPRATVPKTRREFWLDKFETNARRDRRNVEALEAMGWKVLVVWECETREEAALVRALAPLLEARTRATS